MERKSVAVQVHTHGFAEVTTDTLNRVRKYLTDKVIIVCDRVGWSEIAKIKNVNKLCGSYHNHINSPYRNQILGLSHLYRKFPECQWYGNIEWDTMIDGSALLEDLDLAENSWVAGFDKREYDMHWPKLSSIINRPINQTLYFIGCCLFFHHDLLETCEKENFFAKILEASKIYGCHWPDYHDWSVDEALLPSIAKSYNNSSFEFGCYEKNINRDKYLIRYQPEWNSLPDRFQAAHPIKGRKLRLEHNY